MKTHGKPAKQAPIIVRLGSISASIYPTVNRIYRVDPGTGQRVLKATHPQFTLAYYSGTQRVKRKFTDLAVARAEAELVVTNLANGETDVLKLTGGDRADYVRSMQKLREWKPDADLNAAITDFLAAARRLPEHVTVKEAVDFFLKRHPIGLPPKIVREVVDELIQSKAASGKSEVYIKELRSRLGQFAETFQLRISVLTAKLIEDYIRSRGGAGRTQNNLRRLLMTLFKFAIKRGYLPKDHDEMSGVEKATVASAEIEVFTPAELRKLFAACVTPVRERGKWRTREEMIPYLAIAAFCGLRAAEIQRLDWSEVHVTGPERFVEVKAGNAKTASRRTVPISDNCAAWLARYAQASGPVVSLARTDKQLFIYLAAKSGVPWKHNALRHGCISYRLALIKDVGQVSLEAGNSPAMVFKHYRQLVRESEARDWFSITPADRPAILPMPITGSTRLDDATPSHTAPASIAASV